MAADRNTPTATFESTQGDGDTSGHAADVRDLYWEGVQDLRTEQRDYWLNHAFLHGYQWLFWNAPAGRLDEVPEDEERVRATVNRMWPNTRTVISTLMQRELTFEVPPSAADDSHMRGAKLAETIVRAVHHDHNWEQLRENVLYATWKGGTGAICVDWDDEADEILSDDAPGSPVNKGDTYEEHLNITQFVIEPGARDPEHARWWIKSVALPPEQVRDFYDLDETPPADATAGLAPFQRKLMSFDRGGAGELAELTMVFTYYERPNRMCPEGAVRVVVDNKCVFNEPWPFPFKNRLNLVVMRETPRENRWTGDTVMTAARPIQTLFNVSWSSIAEHMKLAGNARLLIPYSSIEMMEAITDLPGEMVPYNDSLPVKPDYLSPPQMPGWWIQQPDMLAQQMDDIMGVHAISRGDAPANIESGFGLTILAEKDATPIGRLTKETGRAFGRLASMVLAIYEDKTKGTKVTRKSTVRMPGNAPIDVEWNGKDLRGQTTAIVPEEAIMPRSRAAAMEFAKDMLMTYGPEEITPATFIALAELPNGRDLLAVTSPDINRARWENAQLALGRQCIPEDFDDHKAHINEHNKYRKTVDYQMLSEEDKQMVADHIQAHATMAAEEIGDGRTRSNLDPALAAAPTPQEGPVVMPLPPAGGAPPPTDGGQPGLPMAAQGALDSLGQPGPTPQDAASEIMQLMSQLGG